MNGFILCFKGILWWFCSGYDGFMRFYAGNPTLVGGLYGFKSRNGFRMFRLRRLELIVFFFGFFKSFFFGV